MSDRAFELAKNIKLLVLDVDGVLTDGGLYYGDNGLAMKRFNVQDGLGIKLAQAVGLEIGVISGLDQKPVANRVNELGIKHYYAGKHKKVPLLKEICEKVGVELSEAAFMGDDWIDIAPCAVPEWLWLYPMDSRRLSKSQIGFQPVPAARGQCAKRLVLFSRPGVCWMKP